MIVYECHCHKAATTVLGSFLGDISEIAERGKVTQTIVDDAGGWVVEQVI